MEDKLKRKILKYIERNDPSHKIVTIDEVNKKIIYSDKIVCHNPIKFENEGYVRAYLVVKLILEMKYPIECIELEKHYNIGSKPKDKNAFIDIIVRDKKTPENAPKTYMLESFLRCILLFFKSNAREPWCVILVSAS